LAGGSAVVDKVLPRFLPIKLALRIEFRGPLLPLDDGVLEMVDSCEEVVSSPTALAGCCIGNFDKVCVEMDVGIESMLRLDALRSKLPKPKMDLRDDRPDGVVASERGGKSASPALSIDWSKF
jgi:hypothetical protein